MKRKSPSPLLFESLRGIRLFLDDIIQITHMASEAGFVTKFSDENFEYDTIEELIENRGTRPRELAIAISRIGGDSTDFSIRFKGPSASLSGWLGGETEKLRYQLVDFIRDGVPWYSKLLHVWAWAAAAVLLISFDSQLINAIDDVSALPLWIHVLPAIAVAGWIAAVANSRLFTGVILRKRHEGGFLKRNADQIVLLVIGSIIGAAITLVVQLLISKAK